MLPQRNLSRADKGSAPKGGIRHGRNERDKRKDRKRKRDHEDHKRYVPYLFLKSEKAKKRLENTEPYFEKLQSTIHHILLHTPEFEHKYFDQREEKKPEDKMIGYIVVTADKGLAGAYNHNVLKLAEQEMAKHKNTCLFVVGQIGRHYFSRKNVTIDAEFLYTAQNPTLYRARAIAETVTDLLRENILTRFMLFTPR